LTPTGFDQLSTLVLALLESCLSSHDYTSALGALDVSTVYFCEKPGKRHGPERVYLETRMKASPLWHDMKFWRANLGHALSMRAIKQARSSNNANTGITTPVPVMSGGSSASSPPLSAADDEFILQWLISAAHQMLSNGVAINKVDDLIQELCRTHKLSAESVKTITEFLAKTKAAMEYWNQ
jgi:hypothetical protein